MRRLLRVLGVLVVAVSLLVRVRICWVAYGAPPGPAELDAQTAYLRSALADGADARMQRLFPEGAFFTIALTGSATTVYSAADLGYLRSLRDRLESPELAAVFGSGMVPEHGIFQAGWSLAVAVDLSARAGDTVDRDVVRQRGEVVARAVDQVLDQARSPFPASYPGQSWPCDSVVAVASLARAAVLLDRPDWLDLVRRWRTAVGAYVDPGTGLLPHRVDPDGRVSEGPRGSSQAIIQAFWPEIATALREPVDRGPWDRFRSTFVVREAGMVGVREFPVGTSGAGDVDSGPLVLGVSASASAVTLAAARTVGDVALTDDLEREAELVGLPLTWNGERRYGFGVLPVGDAFLAWARSRPANAETITTPGPQTAWSLLAGAAALPGIVAGVLLVSLRSRRCRTGSAPAPRAR